MFWISVDRILLAVPRALANRLLRITVLDGLIYSVVVTLVVYAVFLVRRRREDKRARALLEESVRMELNIPPSLHPVIDPDVCIGSGSCLSVCPEGGILGLVNGVATLVSASHCIGHGRCAAECPVNAIKLVFGAAERGVDLPELDSNFETSRPGVYIVGELAGMGLIKNALIQGMQVAVRLREEIDKARQVPAEVFDVVIVGAGPAGIATAIGARAAGLTFALVEQDALGGTIAHYPRQKLVMSESVPLPYYGLFGRAQMSKEDLMEALTDAMGRAKVTIHQSAKVTGLDGDRDAFVVTTSRGVLHARRVVFAIGRRGSPRPIGAPGEELEKVTYRLIDPSQYEGKRVLVVGGGDSALEAAIQLAEGSTAEVGIVYRRPEFARCRPLNKQKIAALLGSGRVRAFMSTDVAGIEPTTVRLKTGGAIEAVENDYVIACLGGELPTEFLKSVGIGIRRHLGDRGMANPALTKQTLARARRRFSAIKLTVFGALVLGVLAAVGHRYYLLPQHLRYQSGQHALLKPSGLWGHSVGIIATLFMLSNFVYTFRKRMRRFKGRGPIGPWLRFHVFVGLMSPLTILFHSAFQWGNHLATATYVSLAVVVSTGLVGRYIYGMVRLDPEHAAQIASMRQALNEALKALPVPLVAPAESTGRGGRALEALLAARKEGATRPPSLFFGRIAEEWALWRAVAQLRPRFLDAGSFEHFRNQTIRLRRFEARLYFHNRFKQLMNVWRILHVTLAILLLGLIGLHVWITVHVGFKWIWS